MKHPIKAIALAWLAASCILAPAAANDVVVKRFMSGQELNSVGIIDASEDTEIMAPQAIYAGEKGDLFVLDQVNGRILHFDPKNADAEMRAYRLPEDLQPTDLVITHNHIVVWDGDLHVLEPRGNSSGVVRSLDEVYTRGVDDEALLSTFAQMGSQKSDAVDASDLHTRGVDIGKSRQSTHQAISSRGEGSVDIDVVSGSRPTTVQMLVHRKGETNLLARLNVEVQDRLGAAEFLEIDQKGHMFVLVEDIPPSTKKRAASFVARYSRSGRLETIYDLPMSQTVARRFVTVTADGDVYFLRTRRNEVDVLGVGSRVATRGNLIDSPNIPPSTAPGATWKNFIAAVRPLTRERVVQTAMAFESVQWLLTASAYGRDPDMACTGFRRIRRPGYLIGKLGQQVRGVPYCWGCNGSLAQIGTRIARGALAGNVCTHNEPRNDVVGVDCSAFVSAAWGLAQHFTTIAIPSITTPVANPWNLLPGDALNKPGSHVMLFLRFTPGRKVEVMESSPGACNGRVCQNVYPLAALLARGFAPVRFRELANDVTASAVEPQGVEPDKKPAHVRKSRARKRHRRD